MKCVCGKISEVRRVLLIKGVALSCGCMSPQWMGKERVKHSCGYVMVHQPEHPFADSQGRIPEHRVVAEKMIGRIINPKLEVVHHKNKIRSDNRISNLEVLSHIDHIRVHNGWKQRNKKWVKPCGDCKKMLPLECFYRRADGSTVYNCKPCARIRGRRKQVV